MTCLLPIGDCLDLTINTLHHMQNKDYDLDELISEILTNLRYTSLYPRSVNHIYRDVISNPTCPIEVTNNKDVEIYNKAVIFLYRSLYTALIAVGAYSEEDNLKYPYFVFKGNSLAVSDNPMEYPRRSS
jgi:hypothetical protein